MERDIGRPVGFQSLRAVFYGWWLVAIGAFIMAVAGDGVVPPFVQQYTLEVYRTAPDFSFSDWMVFYTALGAVGGLSPPFIGMAIDRWGSRKPMLAGLPVVGVGLLLAGWWPRVAVISLVSHLVYLGSELCAYLPAAAAVNHWFRRGRPIAMAVMMFGPAAAGAWAKQLSEAVAQPAILVTGLLVLVVAVPLAFLVRNRPEPYGECPDGMETPDDEAAPDYTVREAVRAREFWMLTLAAIFLSAAGSIVNLNALQLAHSSDVYSLQLDAMGGIRSVVQVLSILVGGYVGCRIPLRRALFWFAACHLAAAVTLLAANGVWVFFLSVALLGMGMGGLQPLSIAALGAYFGRYRFATILGIYIIITQTFSGVGFVVVPWLSYLNISHIAILPAMMAAVLAAIGVAAYLWIRDPRLAPSQAPAKPVAQE